MKIRFCFAIGCILTLLVSFNAVADDYKVLYVDSYDENYWSSSIENGIRDVLDKHDNIVLRTFRMDTKRLKSESAKKAAGLKAKEVIEIWQPDLVITSDDNAAKYLIVPYFMNSTIPFVFCGINSSASHYGLPVKNVTGMIEVNLINQSLDVMKKLAEGERVGFISNDSFTSRKTYDYFVKEDKVDFAETVFIETFDQFKEACLKMQQQVDMIYHYELAVLQGFDKEEMKKFVRENITVPSTSALFSAIEYSLLGIPKTGFEQGAWAAATALRILEGESPADIPVVKNRQAKIYLNMDVAKKLDIKFPVELMGDAHFITSEKPLVLYLDFCGRKCLVNREIKRGVLNSLNIEQVSDNVFDTTVSEVNLKEFHGEKGIQIKNKSKRNIAEKAMQYIEKIQPDLIIAVYDETLEYMLDKYEGKLHIPFLLCGFNWDIDFYAQNPGLGDKAKDRELVRKVLAIAKKYADGSRIGYIGADSLLSRKTIEFLAEKMNIRFDAGELVSSFDELKRSFVNLQESVDVLCLLETANAGFWNVVEMRRFIADNTEIPTVTFTAGNKMSALLGLGQVLFEQGWKAGSTALEIIREHQLVNNSIVIRQDAGLYINVSLGKKLGIEFSPDELSGAKLLE